MSDGRILLYLFLGTFGIAFFVVGLVGMHDEAQYSFDWWAAATMALVGSPAVVGLLWVSCGTYVRMTARAVARRRARSPIPRVDVRVAPLAAPDYRQALTFRENRGSQ